MNALHAAGGTLPTHLPLSLQPQATLTALLSAVPGAAALLAALSLPRPFIERCLAVLLGVGAFQMLLAVLQFWGGPGSALYFGATHAGGLVGSFANRNHLADLLIMLLPLWFWRLSQGLGGAQHAGGRYQSRFGGPGALWLFFGFALLVVILATLSRGALFSGAIVLLACTALMALRVRSHLAKRQKFVLLGAALVFALLALYGVGAERVGQRLNSTTLQFDAKARQDFTKATLEGARTFWPWGSGAGTYEAVFPRFQSAQSLNYVEYAHNDYAQIAMELGAPGALLVLALVALVLAQLRVLMRAYREDQRVSSELALRGFCGLGAAALLMHSLVEFNMHIPALAITAAFLAGVYLRPIPTKRQQNKA